METTQQEAKETKENARPGGLIHTWKQSTWINRLHFLAAILLIVALGFLALNQATGFFFKADVLSNPCGLCKEANKPQAQCIDQCFIVEANPFQNAVRPNITFNPEEAKII